MKLRGYNPPRNKTMKLDVTKGSGLTLGLVLVASVSVYLSDSTARDSTAREKERSNVLATGQNGSEEMAPA